MINARLDRRRALALGGLAIIGGAVRADAQTAAASQGNARGDSAGGEPRHLPADVVTHHSLDLPGRTLHFSATAGAIRLNDDRGAPLVDVAFIAFQLDGTERNHRALTFALNGGPGFASGWLDAGAVGPWRIAIGGDATAPSASPDPLPNGETWLDFTDLVFIDPAGTGYSRVLGGNEEARRRLWSVEGDVSHLAEAMRRWVDRFERGVSPKYILGESYGGFRAPRLVRELTDVQGTGISGLVLVSPALDLGGRSLALDPLYYVARLPSMAATARAAHGAVTRAQLADVEHYAATDFLVDLTRGERDAEAIDRRSERVAAFTGLDPALVRQHHGVIGSDLFLRELNRATNRVGSPYDATVTSQNPFPMDPSGDYADPVLDALKAPVSSAMVMIYETLLNWRPDTPYELWNPAVSRQWDWGRGQLYRPQSVIALRTSLALDPHLTVLIAHGMFDLVTPYFATQLLLDQIPQEAGADRVRLAVYRGGHMFYANDDSRTALREEAKALYRAP